MATAFPSPRRDALLVVCAALLLAAGAFSARDLWAPDEPRYGQVAREMLASGDVLVPHVNGAPYPEKPPLWFWLVTATSTPGGGVTPVTARLVGALLAAGAVLLTARLGTRFFGNPAAGATAALLFASTGLVMWNAPRAALDLPLTFFVLATVERLHAWWHGGRASAALLGGVAWAGAVLVKGPVGFFLPPLVVAGGWIASRSARSSRNAPSWRSPGWWLAPLVMAGLGLAWLLPALDAGGTAYADRLLGQLGVRAVGGADEGHVRGPLYYVVRAAPLLLPWVLHFLAGWGVFGQKGRSTRERFGVGACLAGSVGLVALLSLFATKRELYLLPAVPFAALLAAVAIHRGAAHRLRALGDVLVVACLVALSFGVFVAPWTFERFAGLAAPSTSAIASSALASLGLLAAALWTWARRKDAVAVARGAALFLLLGAAFVHLALLPPLDARKSFLPLARAAEEASAGGEVYAAGWRRIPNLLWRLDRDHVGYLEDGVVVSRLAPGAPRAAVVMEDGYWERLRPRLGGARVAWHGRVGHRHFVVVTNR